MQLQLLSVKNFKGLKDVTIPLSQFGCVIGENNAGKSSIMQALLAVFPGGRKVTIDDFYDPEKPVRIELQLAQIDDADLLRIRDIGHRESVEAMITEESLRLVRVVDTDQKSTLQWMKLAPADVRLREARLDAVMDGLKGAALWEAVAGLIPELVVYKPAATTKSAMREALATYVETLTRDEFVQVEAPLKTGIENALKPLLPEPIYIEAVKNVADEVKTSESATFGKLLKLLLEDVKQEVDEIARDFQKIQRKFSRVPDEDGVDVDARLPEVVAIERLIQDYVRESFPDVGVKMSLPVPDLKTILGSAQLDIDDGHESSVLLKGDGLKRAVAFAILRAYTASRGPQSPMEDVHGAPRPSYLLLFEEPELYLYPRAQQQLFEALRVFSEDHPVLVSTHSARFFDARATKTFVKARKVQAGTSGKPVTEVRQVDLADISDRNAFQLICHENNDVGFFANRVVLVEGDSDALILPHMAKLLRPEWDAVEENISFVRIGGKGNIGRYRDFFGRFDIPVYVVCDLDAIERDFRHLSTTEELVGVRKTLMDALSETISIETPLQLSNPDARTLASRHDAKALWAEAEKCRHGLDGSEEALDRLRSAIDAFFAYARKDERRDGLMNASGRVLEKKQDLLAGLAAEGVHVLSRGAVEAYCTGFPGGSGDKVGSAISFCEHTTSRSELMLHFGPSHAEMAAEMSGIMASIFEGPGVGRRSTPGATGADGREGVVGAEETGRPA